MNRPPALALALLTALAGCGGSQQDSETATATRQISDTIHAYYADIARADYDAACARLTAAAQLDLRRYEQRFGIDAPTCAQTMARAFDAITADQLQKLTQASLGLKVSDVRLHDDGGATVTETIKTATTTVTHTTDVVRDGAAWKLDERPTADR